MTPAESVASVAEAELPALQGAMDGRLLDELWRASDAAGWGLERDDFDRILLDVGTTWNFGLAEGTVATRPEQASFFRGLCLGDLVLARACAAGNERAWEHFIARHRQPLIRAAIAITGSETLGRDLADQLYAELYGLNTREGERRCPLLSYRGSGSLMGWLRTTLAQRHVDHYRRTRREEPFDEISMRRLRSRRSRTPESFRSWSRLSKMRCADGMRRKATCWRPIILTADVARDCARAGSS
jgi:RNA polymerase sigma-70 factor, ECF subfamily